MARHKKPSLTAIQKAQIDTLVKKANQRLREIEKQGFTKEKAYSKVANWSKRDAQFIGTTKNGEIKFRTDVSRLYKENRQAFYDLKQRVSEFLGMETSKTGAIQKKYKKAVKTFKDIYGIDITPNEQRVIFGSSLWDEITMQYDSDDVLELLEKSDSKTALDIYRVLNRLKEGTSYADIEENINKYGTTRRF